MSYNSSATIYVTNNTQGNAVISFSHRYSDDDVVEWQGQVKPGSNAGPLVAGYNTGFIYYGTDRWFCGIHVLDGPKAGYYHTEGALDDPSKQCMLQKDDNGSVLYFSVTTDVFVMTMNSGSCSTSMSEASDEAIKGIKPDPEKEPA